MFSSNKLRKILPTFVWTYGFTKCSAPIYNTKGDMILSACDEYVKFPKKLVEEEKGEYIGLITEKIDGQSLEKFIKSKQMSEEHFLSTLLLIIYSLQEAYKNFKFVHRDLHLENIIMRDLNKTSYVKIPGTNKYINTFKAIPTIFDFGQSSVVINNKLYGNYDFIDFGLDPRKGGIMIDIVKFLVNASTVSNNPIINRLLLLIFEDIKVVDKVYDNYGYLPNTDLIENFDIDYILDEIYLIINESKYNWIITDNPDGQILSAQYPALPSPGIPIVVQIWVDKSNPALHKLRLTTSSSSSEITNTADLITGAEFLVVIYKIAKATINWSTV
jgi:serine/threonine protein kinase